MQKGTEIQVIQVVNTSYNQSTKCINPEMLSVNNVLNVVGKWLVRERSAHTVNSQFIQVTYARIHVR